MFLSGRCAAAMRSPAWRHDSQAGRTLTMTVINRFWIFAIVLLAACAGPSPTGPGPAPVEDHGRTLSQGQYRSGIAYRELEQARYDARLAEQEVLNARDAHVAAQQQTAANKRELDAAEQAYAAARARAATAQQAYEKEVNAVDAAHRASPAAK